MASYTASTPQIWRIETAPTSDGSFSVHAFFRAELVNSEDASDRIIRDAGAALFTLPAELAAQIKALAEAARE